MSTLLIAVAVALLVLAGVLSAQVFAVLRRIRMRSPTCSTLAPQEVPAAMRALLAPGLGRLIDMGFVSPSALQLHGRVAAGQPQPLHLLMLAHAKVPAVAYLHHLPAPDGARHYGISFASRTRSGSLLVTRNRSSILGPVPLPEVITQDCWCHTWREVWRAHRRRMRQIEPDVAGWLRQPLAEWIAQGAAMEVAVFDAMVQAGDYVPDGDGIYRLRLAFALRVVGQAWRQWPRFMRAMEPDGLPTQAGPRAADAGVPVAESPATWASTADAGLAGPSSLSLSSTVQPPPTLSPALEDGAAAPDPMVVDALISSYEQDQRERRASAWTGMARWVLFLITGVAAAVSFGSGMTLSSLAALLVVLLCHEMGHFVAMRHAGYQDLKVFFVPFLGAAVSGRHDQPTVGQELRVLFAGPMPGLVLGLAAWSWVPVEIPFGGWWRDLAVMAVALNAFNLLPIHPLDGGKIFEILLLSRWPWLMFAGRVVGIALLAAMALTVDDPLTRSVMLGVILVLVLGISHLWREATLARALQREGAWGGLSREQALRAVFGGIVRQGWRGMAWSSQRLLATALLPTLTRPVLRPAARIAGLMVYGFCMLLPVAVLLVALRLDAASSRPGFAPSAASARADLDIGRGTTAADAARAAQAAQEARRAQREHDLADLRSRVAAEPDLARRWTLLDLELEPLARDLAAEQAGASPTFDALIGEAHELATRLPDPVSLRATVELWHSAARWDLADRRKHAQAVFDLYAQATATDVGPLLRATEIWAADPAAADPAQRLQRIELSLTAAVSPDLLMQTLTLQRARIDLLMALQDGATARGAARQAFEAALPAGQPRTASALAQLWVDATLATQGLDAALQATELALSQIEVTTKGGGRSTAELRRQGLWLAEAERRIDWQRMQATRLPPVVDPMVHAPWWIRALAWLAGSRHDAAATLEALELAHWQGRTDEARRIGAAIAARQPQRRAPAPPDAGSLGPTLAARVRVVEPARRAVYDRYGLPSAVPASTAGR